MPSIVELFGYDANDASPAAKAARAGLLCPYLTTTCSKGFNDGTPSGVCSLKRGPDVVPVCPRRLYADSYRPLLDIASRYFPKTLQLVRACDYVPANFPQGAIVGFGKGWGGELRLPARGSGMGSYFVDWIVAHVDGDGDLVEFLAVEVQTIDTTGSYRGEQESWMTGQGGGANTAGFNWENVNKRIMPQLIYKGHVLHREQLCKKGLFFVSPLQIHDNMLQRLGGQAQLQTYPLAPGAITFLPYTVSAKKPAPGKQRGLKLVSGSVFTTQVHQIELAFSAARNLPKAGVYENAIRQALSGN